MAVFVLVFVFVFCCLELRSHQFEAVEDNGGGAYLDDHWNAQSPSLQEQSQMRQMNPGVKN